MQSYKKVIWIMLLMSFTRFIAAQSHDFMNYLTINYKNDKIIIEWSAKADQKIKSWNIFRSNSRMGIYNHDAIQLNRKIISGIYQKTDNLLIYKFSDTRTQIKGLAYWYWVEAILSDGEKHTYGPICAYIPAYTKAFQGQLSEKPILSDIKSNKKTYKKWRML